MNKQQFEKLQDTLLNKHGYRKYVQHWKMEDYVLGKSFHKDENQWEEDRSAYQILLCVYDWTLHPEYHDRVPEGMKDRVAMEVCVMVSRIIDERMDLTLAWHDDTTIEEVEQKAESFYQWVCQEYPTPRKEKTWLRYGTYRSQLPNKRIKQAAPSGIAF